LWRYEEHRALLMPKMNPALPQGDPPQKAHPIHPALKCALFLDFLFHLKGVENVSRLNTAGK
jgi:hypothetical protein